MRGRAGWARTELLLRSEDARARSVLERRLTSYLRHWRLPQPDGRNVVLQTLFFVKGLRVFQASVFGERIAPEVAETFFAGIQVAPSGP